MKKFLVVFDGYKMSESSLQYAIQLTRSENAHLVGVFLDDVIYHTYSVYAVITNNSNYEKKLNELDARDKVKRDKSVLKFQQVCKAAKINFSVHRDINIPSMELINESIFADLIIINEYETLTKTKESPPTHFIKNLLSDVQCPVLIVPATFKKIDKIVLLCDGKPFALYAIKMFNYILGNLNQLPVEVLTVKEKKITNLYLPGNRLMKEFLKGNFNDIQYTLLKGNAEQQIVEHLRKYTENVLVVAGAYQRSDISRWFKISMADVLMESLQVPLFIAHK